MNDSFVLRQAQFFADRVRKDYSALNREQVKGAYLIAYGRPPTQPEVRRAIKHLKAHSLSSLCWAIFNSSEFIYVR